MLVEWSLAKLRINIQIIWQILVNWGRVNCCGVNAVPGTAHHCTVSRGVSWTMWNVRRCGGQYWLVPDFEVWWTNVYMKNYISKITGPYGLYAPIHRQFYIKCTWKFTLKFWQFDINGQKGLVRSSKAWGGLVIFYLIFWFFGGGFSDHG